MARTLPGGLVYLRFDGFDPTDRRWLSAQLKEHHDAPGVVIDLRRNSGGDTFSLGISIGEFFEHAVDDGKFIARDGDGERQRSFQLGSARYTGPVAILAGPATASAAEIFSAVLQAQNRAVLSWFYRLPDGGELQLSVRDYVSPRGVRLEGNGVEPDVAVTAAPTLAEFRAGRDPELETAMTRLQVAR